MSDLPPSVERADPSTPNAAQRRRWSDPSWVANWIEREPVTAVTTDSLLDHLDLRPGDRVVDLGCGTGNLTRALAEAVGPTGHVVGMDISEPLVEIARNRSGAVGGTVTFTVGDVQVAPIPEGPFAVATSQFGVLFFDDPVAAFSNVARHVAPGGRLGFVCWQALEENPWNSAVAAARFLPAPPSMPTGAAPPGPFSMADPARVRQLLDSSGWSAVDQTPYRRSVVFERSVLDPRRDPRLADIAEADRPAAVAAMEAHLASFTTADGGYEVPLAFQVFTARRG